MRRKKIIYIILLAILFASYLAVEILKPKQIDWSLDFSATKKIPYGCFVLKELLSETKPESKIRINHQSLYDALGDSTIKQSGIVIITDEFNPAKTDITALLNFIAKGNHAFVSSINFGKLFTDTLSMVTNIDLSRPLDLKNPVKLNFVNPRLTAPKFYEFSDVNPFYISSFDTLKTTIIGRDAKEHAIFISISIGKGVLFVHTKPEVFTNYHLLYSNSEYALKALTYLHTKYLVWDEYYKPKALAFENRSPIRYILSQESLRYAYFLLLFTIGMFMIFESKRRQRIIPVLAKPVNSSMEFVSTIARLYLNQRNNTDLANKKIQHFYDFISDIYYLKANETSAKFRKQFSEKAGITMVESDRIFDEIVLVKNNKSLSDKELLILVKLIEHIQYQTIKP